MGQISTEIISPPGSTLSENQHAQLAASCQLVVNEVHRPHIVRSDRRSTVLAQLRLHPPLGGLVAQLQAQLPVKPIDLLWVHDPALAAQDVIDTTIAVANVRLADLLDSHLKKSRRSAERRVGHEGGGTGRS